MKAITSFQHRNFSLQAEIFNSLRGTLRYCSEICRIMSCDPYEYTSKFYFKKTMVLYFPLLSICAKFFHKKKRRYFFSEKRRPRSFVKRKLYVARYNPRCSLAPLILITRCWLTISWTSDSHEREKGAHIIGARSSRCALRTIFTL